MARIQLSTAITKAITSGAYFTRINDVINADERQLMALNPELYKQRMQKFDSPNNIKGIIVQTTGIYVENYHGYGTMDKRSNKPVHYGNRIKTNKKNNEQFSLDIADVYQGQQTFIINNNWLFQPSIQNIQYIYFDDVLSALIGRNLKVDSDILKALNYLVLNQNGSKGNPTRKSFPKLIEIAYIPQLGKFIGNHESEFTSIYTKAKTDETWSSLFCNTYNITKIAINTIDMLNWEEVGITQSRPDIYMYDQIFIAEQTNKEKQAIEEKQAADKENQKKVDKEGYGIPGVFEVKEEYGEIIEQYMVKPIIDGYKYLLQIGYSGPRTNDGMLSKEAGQAYLGQDGRLVYARNKVEHAKDVDLYTKIDKAFRKQGINTRALTKNQVELANQKLIDTIDFYNQLMIKNENSLSEFNYVLGFKLIKGYLHNCKIIGNYSTENINNTAIINWPGMAEYLKSTLLDIAAILIVKNGIYKSNTQNQNAFATQSEIQAITEFCSSLRKLFCFGVYTSKQYSLDADKKLLQTEIRICLPVDINIDKLYADFQAEMPVKVEKVRVSKPEGNTIYSFCTFKVLYDEDTTKDMIQATKALQSLKEKNQKPSWSRALLGEKDDGTPFFWEGFMSSNNSPYKRAYQIYAGSRSGKGILTNTLISNAIANGYKVFFIDGKPDTGITLGNIAWKSGKEAFVFDGMRVGQSEHQPGQLEEYSYGIRNPNEQMSNINQIPKRIRDLEIPQDLVEKLKEQSFGNLLVATTTYYKCVELVFKVIEYRAAGNRGTPEDDWAIFIIDECAKIAERESFIRKYLTEYIKSEKERARAQGIKIDNNREDFRFIENWFRWLDGIQSQVQTAQTMSLGNQQQNIFFIFQGQKWIQQYSDTFMCKGLMQLSTTKIIGNDAIQDRAPQQYGNTTTKKLYDWPNYVSQPLHWVITKKSDAGSCSDEDVYRFKPYSLWGSSRSQMLNGQPDDFRYMQYYIREIEQYLGIDAAQILEQAYLYAENFVRQVSNKNNLKEYVYSLDFLLRDYSGNIKEVSQNSSENNEFNIDSMDENVKCSEDINIQDIQDIQVQQFSQGGNKFSDEALQKILNSTKVNKQNQQILNRQINKEFNQDIRQSQQIQSQYNQDNQGGQQNQQNQQNQYNQANYGMRLEDTINFEVKQAIEQPDFQEDGSRVNIIRNKKTELLDNENAELASQKTGLALGWVKNKLDRYSPSAVAENTALAVKQAKYSLLAGGALLSQIADLADGYRKVKDIKILSNQIWVNDKYLVLPQYMQDEDLQLNLRSMISFKKLFKNFKQLQELTIDQEYWTELKEEFNKYEESKVQQIFKTNKKLQGITIISQQNGNAIRINRVQGLNFQCKESNEERVKRALEKGQKKEKVNKAIRDSKRLGPIAMTKNAISNAKHELWGSPVNKALTITTSIATMGLLGLTFGPLVLLGTQFASRMIIGTLVNKK